MAFKQEAGRLRTMQLHVDLGNSARNLSDYLQNGPGQILTPATEVYKVSVKNIAVDGEILTLEVYDEKKMERLSRASRNQQRDDDDDDDDVVHLADRSDPDSDVMEVAPVVESDVGSQHSDALSLAGSEETRAAEAQELDVLQNLPESGSLCWGVTSKVPCACCTCATHV